MFKLIFELVNLKVRNGHLLTLRSVMNEASVSKCPYRAKNLFP